MASSRLLLAPQAGRVDGDEAPGRRARTATSTESRVVPGTSETIMRSSRASLLINVDLPALRRPTTAIFITGWSRVRLLIEARSRAGGTMMRSYSSVSPPPFWALIDVRSLAHAHLVRNASTSHSSFSALGSC